MRVAAKSGDIDHVNQEVMTTQLLEILILKYDLRDV